MMMRSLISQGNSVLDLLFPSSILTINLKILYSHVSITFPLSYLYTDIKSSPYFYSLLFLYISDLIRSFSDILLIERYEFFMYLFQDSLFWAPV